MPIKRVWQKVAMRVPKATKKYIKRVMDASREDKYIDLVQTIATATAATDSVGSVVLLSGVSQGNSAITRLGEVINPKKLIFRYDTQGTSATIPTYFRIIVFRDMQIRSSTLPTVADVLETVAYDAQINRVALNANRFNILYDRLHQLGSTGSGPADNTFQRGQKTCKLRGKIVYTNSSTGTQKGNVYVLYLSNGNTNGTPTNSPPINFNSRIVFEDA